MQISSMFGHLPGMGTVVETFEAAYCWGPYPRYFTGAYIGAGAVDSGNSPTTTLRMGLVMGKQIATGQWVNYSPTATDGSEVAAGVLVENLRMTDVVSGATQARFYAIMVSGGVQSAKLIGLDSMARAQMSKVFLFDDYLPGNDFFPYQRFQTKTTNYSILASDNGSHFDNTGAGAPVTFTLPPIANGLFFGFTVVAGQNLAVTSFEGTNIVAFNNASASTLTFSTAGALIGGMIRFYTNPGATKWLVEVGSAGANTITVS
jgi:hypothetical protein